MEKELERNAKEGLNIVHQALIGERPMTDLVKAGSSAVTQYIRYLSTKGANNAVRYAAMRDIAGSRIELKNLILEYGGEILPIKKKK